MTLPKNRFPVIFGGHLEFLHKMQKRLYLDNGARYSDFEFLTHRVSAESTGEFSHKSFLRL